MPKIAIKPNKLSKSICLVAAIFTDSEQSRHIGEYYKNLANLLSNNGWNVTFLLYDNSKMTDQGKMLAFVKSSGINVFNAFLLCEKEGEPINEINRDSSSAQATSHIIHNALAILIKKHDFHFDLIEFADSGAPGFIPIRMNKDFKTFGETRLIINLHGPSARIKEEKMQESASMEDLIIDYMEQYCFENADIQASTSDSLLQFCRKSGWKVREDCAALTKDENIVSWYNEILFPRIIDKKIGIEFKSKTVPEVVIILAYYNMHQYVEKTLWSLYNQTYKNFRIILVNDGSNNPESLAMLEQIKIQHPDILVLNKQNGGIGSARNFALPYVDSKYIIVVDADNIAKPEMIQTLVESMENRDNIAVLCCYNAKFQDQDEQNVINSISSSSYFKPVQYYKPIGSCLPLLFLDNTQGDANSIYRTEVIKSIGGWSENKHASEDWDLWLKLIASGYENDVIPLILYYYRISPNQETHKHNVYGRDRNNFVQIRSIMEKRPEYFFNYGYIGIHQLIRSLNNRSTINNQSSLDSRYKINLIGRTIRYAEVHGIRATCKEILKYL